MVIREISVGQIAATQFLIHDGVNPSESSEHLERPAKNSEQLNIKQSGRLWTKVFRAAVVFLPHGLSERHGSS